MDFRECCEKVYSRGKIYPSGMRIPGRSRCNCFLAKHIHHGITGKFNRDEYRIMTEKSTSAHCCSVSSRRPLSRRFWKQCSAGIVFILFVLGVLQRTGCLKTLPSDDFQRYHDKIYTVVKVVDGDTLDLDIPDAVQDKPHTRVRLWGVDTPETKHPRMGPQYFGAEADAFTRKFTLHQRVKISLEPFEKTRGKYGRLLAYLYLPNNKMLNEELIVQGYAYADDRFRHMFRKRFQDLQKQAQRQKQGLWQNVQPHQWPQWYRKRHDPNNRPSARPQGNRMKRHCRL